MRRKTVEKRGPGFGYGFLVAMCFTLAFFTLLCGLVLNGFSDVVSRQLAADREHLARPVHAAATPSHQQQPRGSCDVFLAAAMP